MKYSSNFKKIVERCLGHGWFDKDPFLGFKMTQREVERTAMRCLPSLLISILNNLKENELTAEESVVVHGSPFVMRSYYFAHQDT